MQHFCCSGITKEKENELKDASTIFLCKRISVCIGGNGVLKITIDMNSHKLNI